MKNPRVLITGGAGFIGSHTADALAGKGYKIRLLDNLQKPVHNGRWPRYVERKGYELMRGDVRQSDTWAKALKGVSYVYHLAAYQDQRLDFSRFFETNTVSTALLYEHIVNRKLPVKKVILASSQFVYGDGFYECAHKSGVKKVFHAQLRSWDKLLKNQWDIFCPHGKPARHVPFREDQKVDPTNSYGLSKYALETTALRLGRVYEIPSVIFRYSIVQGPRQSPRNLYSGALRIFVSQGLADVPMTVYEDGQQTRDFVNVHDVTRANVMALRRPEMDYEVFNVGGGKPYRVFDFAEHVKRILNSPSEINIGAFRRTDTRHAVSDISKLKRLGWTPKYTIDDSIHEYVKWFKAEGFHKQLNVKNLRSLKAGIKR